MVGDNIAGSVLLDVCTTTHSRENEEFCFGSIFVFLAVLSRQYVILIKTYFRRLFVAGVAFE